MISKVLVLFSLCVILSAIFLGIYRAKVKESGKKKWRSCCIFLRRNTYWSYEPHGID